MPESNGSEMPEFFPAVKIYKIPCTIEDSLAPSEVQATVILGSKTLYILAPITKVDPEKRTIQMSVVGQIGDSYLVSFPGEVENGTSTMRVSKSLVDFQ